MEAPIYSIKGDKVGAINLPDNIFAVRWNADLVKQVADSLLSSARTPIAHTKNRGEVRGGGKKPWQQKGTGRARHGSIRSPLWVGGGVAHGPRNEKNFERKVSKKMKTKALYTILSRKFKEGEVLFVDSIKPSEPKTKVAIQSLQSLAKVEGFKYLFSKRNNAAVLVVRTKDRVNERAFRNLSNIELMEARNLNPLVLLQYKYLVIENPESSITSLPKMESKASTKNLVPST